jgi:hypothetical protein
MSVSPTEMPTFDDNEKNLTLDRRCQLARDCLATIFSQDRDNILSRLFIMRIHYVDTFLGIASDFIFFTV